MSWDSQKIYSVDLITNDPVVNDQTLAKAFINFIESFRHGSAFLYRETLQNSIKLGTNTLTVQLEHLSQYDESTFQALLQRPEVLIGVFEKAIIEQYQLSPPTGIQLMFTSSQQFTSLRELEAAKANRIVRIQGIVVSASTVITKPKGVFLLCKNCLNSTIATDMIPRSCITPECPIDPFVILPEKSIVTDMQFIKIQERFEDIPVGEMPRHFMVVLEKGMVNTVIPGSKIEITGIYCIRSPSTKQSTSKPFIKAIGLSNKSEKNIKNFTEEEEEIFSNLARSNIYERITHSIAPSIFGHIDIKKALACMLFGGTRRILKDGVTLRGDINILLLGDPGVAKSQMLKFVERVSPVAIYTSGKGSSAAGLTASVIKNQSGEFYLEGGALVLADGGVCCIDEFDKMDENDRVAIHEAMEQQTISIAKAGITTVLNTRTSVLAAANPIFGRYDDLRTPAENIEFGATILSRFDCIFVMRDECNSEEDIKLAKHVLGIHKNNITSDISDDTIDINTLKRYIQYARTRVFPTLSSDAQKKLSLYYTHTRRDIRRLESTNHQRSTIPITIRQLEAIIRMSEALARMELSNICTEAHVEEAIRLFKVSTMNAVARGYYLEGMQRPEVMKEIEMVCSEIEKILPVGHSLRYDTLVDGLSRFKSESVVRAIQFMVNKGKLLMRDKGNWIARVP
ncbi:Minichromosome maintenance protein 5 [Astathelohania contejeani]|uniref:DNA replication licensing factor MCM5 n=1 Tax=Astathelohania contejeani TaxID=164912 RepID=A0ABQ7HXN0_9MICR|nr:Minichromosome maintenance protein 5 [Thelohania contejeani]